MENSLKGLILAAGTIITCVVITLAFFISREAKQTAVHGAEEINELNVEFAESNKLVYDNTMVSGSEVINAVKKFAGDHVGVMVQTNKGTCYYGYNFNQGTGELGTASTLSIADATQSDNQNYINPYATFKGTVVRDSNDTITGLVFIQS